MYPPYWGDFFFSFRIFVTAMEIKKTEKDTKGQKRQLKRPAIHKFTLFTKTPTINMVKVVKVNHENSSNSVATKPSFSLLFSLHLGAMERGGRCTVSRGSSQWNEVVDTMRR